MAIRAWPYVRGYTFVAIRAWLHVRDYTCVAIRAWLYVRGPTCVAIPEWTYVCGYTFVAIRSWLYVRGYTCVAIRSDSTLVFARCPEPLWYGVFQCGKEWLRQLVELSRRDACVHRRPAYSSGPFCSIFATSRKLQATTLQQLVTICGVLLSPEAGAMRQT